MKKLLLLTIFILSSCTSYKNLKSNYTADSWVASFGKFNGKEQLEFKGREKNILYLSSELDAAKGNLFLSENKEQILNLHKINHTKFSMDKALKLQIEGKNATGSFALKYPVFAVKTIHLDYHPNVELLCLSNFLINYSDFTDIPDDQSFTIDGKEVKVKDLYALNLKIGNEFKPFLKSKNLEIIRTYFDKDFYLHYSNFVLNLDRFPNAKVASDNKFLTQFPSFEDAVKFTIAFNDFYSEINFGEFLYNYQPFYNEMIKEVSQNLPQENFITEMEHFFGKSATNYNLYPSLTMPFSSGFAVGNEDSVGNIFGSFTIPENINDLHGLKLGFNNSASLRTICVHEFGHSFVNPAVDQVRGEIVRSKEDLFGPIKSKMSEQGYNQWKICLYEHFNRANEVMIAKLLGDNKKAVGIFNDNVKNRAFIYLPQIIEKLEFWYYNEFFTKTYEEKVSEIISGLSLIEG